MVDRTPHSDARAVVMHVVDTLSGGGTERALVALLNRFDTRRVRHVVVTMRDAGPGSVRLPEHVACCALGLTGVSRFGFLRLARVARRWNASVMHARNTGCWMDTAIAALITPGATATLGFHGLDRANGLDERVRRRARWATRLGALFTSVSYEGARRLRDALGVPQERITVLRNGVDLERFKPIDLTARRRLRARLGLPQDAILIGGVGSLTRIKRFDLLIDGLAASRIRGPQPHLVFVGSGPLRDTLGRRAAALGLEGRVHFPGQHEDVPDYFAAFDIYVCSSDFEGVSNALLEAMACGLPVITTWVGDHAAIVRDGQEGLTIEPGHVQGLADALDRLCLDESLRRQMGAAGRRRAADSDFSIAVHDYESYYGRLLACATDLMGVKPGSDSRAASCWPQAV